MLQMNKLAEELLAVVKEYTRQVVELFDASESHWIGLTEDFPIAEVLDLDGELFLTWSDVQVIVDRMDDWLARYGSKDAVAQDVRDWENWWLDDTRLTASAQWPEIYEERWHRYQRTRPMINLKSWLMGCPRDVVEKPSLEDELRVMAAQRDMLAELADRYRDTRSLWNVLDSLDAEIKEKKKTKEKRDAALLEEMKQRAAYKEFRDLQDKAIEGAF